MQGNCVWKRKLSDTTTARKALERMKRELASAEHDKAHLVQAVNTTSIDVWRTKLQSANDCLEGRQKFRQSRWKRGGGVEGTWLGTAWSVF